MEKNWGDTPSATLKCVRECKNWQGVHLIAMKMH